MTSYHARWVLPVTQPAIENGTVTVENGRITHVGPREGAPRGESVDLGDAILMPGLVNTHCHLELTAMRGFLEDLDFRRWILRLTSAKRSVLSAESLLDSARAGLEEGIAAGITTYADTCDSGAALDAMVEYGVRGIMYQELFGPDPAQCEASVRDFNLKLAALRSRATSLVRVGISPHAPYTVSDDLFRASAAIARDEGLPMAIHVAESEVESELVVHARGAFAEGLRGREIVVEPRGASPVRLLESLGVLDLRPLLIHCVRVDARDLDLIAARRARVAHCPVSNAKLGHGIAPLVETLSAGIDVGLGSDSTASNNRMNLLEEARAALLLQRARIGTHEALSAADVLELATIGGACALGLGDETGSLEVGKAADLAAFEIGHAGPVHDPAAAAVFALDGSRASFVAVAGVPIVVSGKLTRAVPGLSRRVQASADALRDWLMEGGELQPPPPVGVR
ncbi:MAG TPA: amidohydrolase family protein [Gemmatimonadaceae bacterium]|nr:amidohydrolase family protein [Gemmatimonadaceae bacterium]